MQTEQTLDSFIECSSRAINKFIEEEEGNCFDWIMSLSIEEITEMNEHLTKAKTESDYNEKCACMVFLATYCSYCKDGVREFIKEKIEDLYKHFDFLVLIAKFCKTMNIKISVDCDKFF